MDIKLKYHNFDLSFHAVYLDFYKLKKKERRWLFKIEVVKYWFHRFSLSKSVLLHQFSKESYINDNSNVSISPINHVFQIVASTNFSLLYINYRCKNPSVKFSHRPGARCWPIPILHRHTHWQTNKAGHAHILAVKNSRAGDIRNTWDTQDKPKIVPIIHAAAIVKHPFEIILYSLNKGC